MREILSDLVAEEQHLDQFLQGLSDREWKKPTPAAGWTIQDQVSHLAHVEGLAAEVLEQGKKRIVAEDVIDIDEWTAVVTNHTKEHKRYPLSIAMSNDCGVTWGDPWHIETIEYEVSYPSFLVDRSSTIHGVYTYNRRMIKYVSYKTSELLERQ